jgi:hypothetical protein
MMPPSGAVPAHSMPSGWHALAGPVGAGPQSPSCCCPVFVHTPEQQSLPAEHESPICPQNEGCWQVPLMQYPEQHDCNPLPHALPSVAHVVVSAVHFPPEPHSWLQHCPFDVHALLSDVHGG